MQRILQYPLVRVLATIVWFIGMVVFIISIPALMCVGFLSLADQVSNHTLVFTMFAAGISGLITFVTWPISYIDI